MARHNDLGRQGEQLAQAYLRNKGYQILATNWRSGHNEIDIVAETDHYLVVVEIKTRTGNFVSPHQAINAVRINRLVNAAHHYIVQHDIHKETRFDVIFIIKKAQNFHIEHLEDAFLPPIT